MNIKNVQKELLAPFSNSDIEWRLQWVNNDNTSGIAVPYVTNRAIQARLDDVVGIGNWKNEYIPWHSAVYIDSYKNQRQTDSQICGISIYFEDRSEWITKYDGAEDSEIESIKGGLSDSMKRAAVQWGIGRYLYSMDSIFVDVELNKKGKPDFKKGQRPKLDTAHQTCVKKIFGNAAADTTPNAPQQQQAAPQAQQPAEPTQAAVQQATQPTQNTTSSPQSSVVSPQQTAPQAQQQPIPAPTVAQDGCYYVVNTVLVPSVKGGNNTNLQLRDTNGKTIQAYMQGTNPGLISGVWIVNAKISSHMKEGIVFFSLNEFELAEPVEPQAA